MAVKTNQQWEKDLKEFNDLNAINKVANSSGGKVLIGFILGESCLDYDSFEIGKNSGNTAHYLGKQSVGRALVDKLIEAGISVPGSVFSKKKGDRRATLTIELNKRTGDNENE